MWCEGVENVVGKLLINVPNGASNNALMIIMNATKNYEKIINGFEH